MMIPTRFGKPLTPLFYLTALFLLATLAAFANAVDLSASVDRDKLSVNDSLTLSIRSSEVALFESPDFSVLEQDFEIVGAPSRSSQYRNINGRSESFMEWSVELIPKREGALVIPPIDIQGSSTEAIIIEVSKARASSNPNEPIFLEAELDKAEVRVQEQLLLTVRVYYGVAIARGANLSDIEIPDTLVEQVNEASYETRINQMRYNVHEITYAIFPQRSGELLIPAQTFTARLSTGRRSVFDPLGGTGKTVRAMSEEQRITVAPKAQAFTGKHWLPATRLSLVETWSKDINQLRVGEPITRSLTITAEGLQASQIPPLSWPDLQGAQQYPDQEQSEDQQSAQGITATRIESAAIIPDAAGKLVIPTMRIAWWNTATGKQESAIIPEKTLQILAAPGAVDTSPLAATPDPAADTPNAAGVDATDAVNSVGGVASSWKALALLSLLGWVATVGTLIGLYTRGKLTFGAASQADTPRDDYSNSDEEDAFSRVTGSAQNPVAFRSALIHWAQGFWHDNSISSLGELASRLDNEQAATTLQALDAALYSDGGTEPTDISTLLAQLSALREQERKRGKKWRRQESNPLEALYKTHSVKS